MACTNCLVAFLACVAVPPKASTPSFNAEKISTDLSKSPLTATMPETALTPSFNLVGKPYKLSCNFVIAELIVLSSNPILMNVFLEAFNVSKRSTVPSKILFNPLKNEVTPRYIME